MNEKARSLSMQTNQVMPPQKKLPAKSVQPAEMPVQPQIQNPIPMSGNMAQKQNPTNTPQQQSVVPAQSQQTATQSVPATAQQNTQQTPATKTETPQTQQPSNAPYSYVNNVDYQALIDQAVASGNYQLAAVYEQQRNAKIAGEGLAYEQTNKYAAYLPGNTDLSPLITQLYDAEAERIRTETNYETQGAVDQLNRALQDAQPSYEQAIANQLLETKQAKDAQALYNQVQGDRGGIGSARMSSIENTGAKNREAIASQQKKLATDTARQIADLRAQGKYKEATLLLQNSQQQLSALYNEQVRLQQEQQQKNEVLASLGAQFLSAGTMPPDNLLVAMGLDRDTAQSYIGLINAQQNAGSNNGNYNNDEEDITYGPGIPEENMKWVRQTVETYLKMGDIDGMYNALGKIAGQMSQEQAEKFEEYLRERLSQLGFSG